MANSTQQHKLRQLFDASPREFKMRFEQSLGIHTDANGRQYFDANKRELDHKDWQVGEALYGVVGPNWRRSFEQNWKRASTLRFEGVGGDITAGDTPYVSAGLDVVAGLMNARALQRAQDPEWIYDRMCTVQEASGEGGFHIGSRVRPDNQTFYDLADDQQLPSLKATQTRVHRNRTLNQGARVKVNFWQLHDDLTGQIMETVDQMSVFVLQERERKVADAILGVSTGTTLATGTSIGVPGQAFPITQDGMTWFPWQTGSYGANANSATPAPENGIYIANYANDGTSTTTTAGDGKGLSDYTAIVKAMQILFKNRDPFTGLPIAVPFRGMQFLVAPAASVQLKFLLQAEAIWQVAQYGLGSTSTPAGVASTTSRYNLIQDLNLEVIESQFWMNRLVDAGVFKTYAAGGAYHQTLTNSPGDSYNTAGSIMSAFYMGHFKDAAIYWQRMPYHTENVPLSSIEYGEQTVLIQDHRERGQLFWHDPRKVYRTWA
jgi:hypothetical protein